MKHTGRCPAFLVGLLVAVCLALPARADFYCTVPDSISYRAYTSDWMDIEVSLPTGILQLGYEALQEFCWKTAALFPLAFASRSRSLSTNLLLASPYLLHKLHRYTASHFRSALCMTQLFTDETAGGIQRSSTNGELYQELYQPPSLLKLGFMGDSELHESDQSSLLSKVIGYSMELLPGLKEADWVVSQDDMASAAKENDNSMLLSINDRHTNHTFMLSTRGDYLQLQEESWLDDKRARSWLVWPKRSTEKPAPLVISIITEADPNALSGKTVFVIPEWTVPAILRQGFFAIYSLLFDSWPLLVDLLLQQSEVSGLEVEPYSGSGQFLPPGRLACEGMQSIISRWQPVDFERISPAALTQSGQPVKAPVRGEEAKSGNPPAEQDKPSQRSQSIRKKTEQPGGNSDNSPDDKEGQQGTPKEGANSAALNMKPELSYLEQATENLYYSAGSEALKISLAELKNYVNSLNKSALLQVLPVHGQPSSKWPLVIGNPLRRYLDYLEEKDWPESEQKMKDRQYEGYYQEVDSNVLGRLLTYHESICQLQEGRASIYRFITKLLSDYSKGGFNPKIVYRVYGGDAVNQLLEGGRLGDGGRTKNTLVITGDVDVLMSGGSAETFHGSLSKLMRRGVTSTMTPATSFTFPCQTGKECFFGGYKITFSMEGFRTEDLPNLDIAFPFPEIGRVVGLLDSHSVVVSSLSRSISFMRNPVDKQKALDRLLWLTTVIRENPLNTLFGSHFVTSAEVDSGSVIDVFQDPYEQLRFFTAQLTDEQRETKELKIQLRDLEKSLKGYQEELGSHRENYNSMVSQYEEAGQEQTREKQQLEKQIAEKEKSLKETQEELEDYRENYDAITDQNREIRQEQTRVKRQLKEQIAERERSLDDEKSRQKILEAQHKELVESSKKERQTLRESIEELKSKERQFNQYAKNWKKKIEKAKAEKQGLAESREQLQREHEKARKEFENQLKKLEQKVTRFQEEKGELLAELNEEIKKKASHTQAVAALEKQAEELAAREKEFAFVHEQLASLKRNMAQLQKERDALIEKLEQEITAQQLNKPQPGLQTRQRRKPDAISKPATEGDSSAFADKRESQKPAGQNWAHPQSLLNGQRIALGVVAALMVYSSYVYEFKPRYLKWQSPCSRLSNRALLNYCLHHQIEDDELLALLASLDQMPEATRVLEFVERDVDFGKALSSEFRVGEHQVKARKQYPIQRMVVPASLLMLEQVPPEDWRHVLDSLLHSWQVYDHGKVSPENFARASLLMCGIQVSQYWQDECYRSLLAYMNKNGHWPHEKVRPPGRKGSVSESYIVGSLTAEASKETRFALLPTWVKLESGKLEWRDLWPYHMKQQRIMYAKPDASCKKILGRMPFQCDGGSAKVWYFSENYWKLLQDVKCTGRQTILSFPESATAVWFQATAIISNDVFACHRGKLIKNAWVHPTD